MIKIDDLIYNKYPSQDILDAAGSVCFYSDYNVPNITLRNAKRVELFCINTIVKVIAPKATDVHAYCCRELKTVKSKVINNLHITFCPKYTGE